MPVERSKRGKLQYCGKPFPCGSIPPGVCEPCTTRTPMQRHCNAMLMMRRTMKDIAKVMRVDQALHYESVGVVVSHLDKEGQREMAEARKLMDEMVEAKFNG